MTDLFDYGAAVAARDEAMQRVDANAAPAWSQRMFDIVVEVARKRHRFTADDVFDLAAERGVGTTHDLRAFGPVMMRAARAEVCTKADCAPQPSRRRSLHASPRAVWQSLVCQLDPNVISLGEAASRVVNRLAQQRG